MFAANWIATYEQTFRSLPAGTKVILDVVDTPEWETGSSDEHTPPANPHEYAAFVGALAQRFGSRVSAYEIWNEEDSPGWWTGAPNATAYTQLLKATYPADQGRRPERHGGARAGSRATTTNSSKASTRPAARAPSTRSGVHTDTACNKLSPYEFLRGADEPPGPGLVPGLPRSARGDARQRRRQADLDDRAELAHDQRDVLGRRVGGADGRGRERRTAGDLPASRPTTAWRKTPTCRWRCGSRSRTKARSLSGLLRANGSRKPSFAAMQLYAHEGDKLNEPCGVFTRSEDHASPRPPTTSVLPGSAADPRVGDELRRACSASASRSTGN